MAECMNKLLSSSPTTPGSKKSLLSAKTTSWQQRLFGKQLIKCSQVNQDSKPCEVNSVFATVDGHSVCEVIGVYFSFINPGATCDDFTRHLTELYNSVNGYNQDNNGTTEDNQERVVKRKKFEVVHVVLWSNVADVLDFEESFRNHVTELPWLAVPNQDYERKVGNLFCIMGNYSQYKNESEFMGRTWTLVVEELSFPRLGLSPRLS